MATYKVIRFYRSDNMKSRKIKSRLSLEQAQAHCQDPETSSSTCTKAEGKRRTKLRGPWFDGYSEE